MRVLSHGLPFFCDCATLKQYRGPHEIRSISAREGADYRYRPERHTIHDVVNDVLGDWRPDLMVVWTPENDPPPLGIEEAPFRTAAVAGDWNLFFGAQEFNLGRYDVVVSDKPGVSVLTNRFVSPSYALPIYAFNSLLHRDLGLHRDIDVLYVGNLNTVHRRERAHFFQRLAELCGRYHVVLTTDLWREDYVRLHNRAKIVFNHSVRGELNLRVFETMACGAMALLEDSNQEVHDCFEDGREIVLYGMADLEEKIAYYIEHETERAAIAQRGQARVQALAGERRYDALLDHIARQPDSGRRFRSLPAQEQAVQTLLMYGASQYAAYTEVERRVARGLTADYPEDARSWAGFGHALAYERDRGPDPRNAAEIYRAFRAAVGLAPDSAVFGLTASMICALLGQTQLEELFLRITVKAPCAEPAAFLFGGWHTWLYTRWLWALPCRETRVEWLHAEAHIRLARMQHGRGDDAAALEHLETARRLDPENRSGVTLLGRLLWECGAREQAVDLLLRECKAFDLDAAYRLELIPKCAAVGRDEMAQVLQNEVQSIIEVALPVSGRKLPEEPLRRYVRDHAARIEQPPIAAADWQERHLREQAESDGDYGGLLYFYAVQRNEAALAALAPAVHRDADRLVLRVLQLPGQPGEASALVEPVLAHGEPWLVHALGKFLLGSGQTQAAYALAVSAIAAAPACLATVNFMIRWLSQRGETTMRTQLIERSLAAAPGQADIEALKQDAHPDPLYAGVWPRHVRFGFYLPVYNVEAYVRRCLEGIFAQDHPLTEVIVVNDGTRDNSIAVAQAFPVTVIHHAHNRGLAAARNTAFLHARCDWLAAVDTDAWPERGYLRHLAMEIAQAPANLAGAGGRLLETFRDAPGDRFRTATMAQEWGNTRLQPVHFLYGATACFRRETVLDAGGYDEKHRTNGEDTHISKTLAGAGFVCAYVPQAVAHHMRRDSLRSALRTWWNWYYWNKIEMRSFDTHDGRAKMMGHRLWQAADFMSRTRDDPDPMLCYLMFLQLFHDALLDFAYCEEQNTLHPHEAAYLRQNLRQRVARLDARHQGNVNDTLQRHTHYLCAEEDPDRPAVSQGFAESYAPYFAELDAFCDSIDAPAYERIARGAAAATDPAHDTAMMSANQCLKDRNGA
ncbi:MAG: glycosyltransferase [Candidatus Hydrogenedentota bacterium]